MATTIRCIGADKGAPPRSIRLGLVVVESNEAARKVSEQAGFVAPPSSQPLASNPELSENLMVLNLAKRRR